MKILLCFWQPVKAKEFKGKSLTTYLLENAYAIRTIQELLGHWNLQTTMIYTYMATKSILKVKNPLDR